jgi:hypothetical protein
MPTIIEFIKNTNFKIQMWIMKITCKLYNHITRKDKTLKTQKKSESSKCWNPSNKLNPKLKIWLNLNMIKKKGFNIYLS